MGQLIHTFTVEDTEHIIPKVKEDYGDKALIITNKQIRPKTLNRSALYEVMVAVEESDYEEHLKNKANPYLRKKLFLNPLLFLPRKKNYISNTSRR